MRLTHTDCLTLCNREDSGVFHYPGIVDTEIRLLDDDDYGLFYRGTCLITFHSDNSITLFTKGWRTKTTKHRLSTFGPCNIFQRDNVWYLHTVAGDVKFEDGMRVNPWGQPWMEFDETDPYAMEATLDNQIFKECL
jgi:hypothetical protein